MASDLQRLNLGSGTNAGIGWINLDCNYDSGDRVVDGDGTRFIGANFYGDDLPFAEASVDGIVMNHSLQCLTAYEIPEALRQCRYVLKPGGVLRILVPDVVNAFYAYIGNADIGVPDSGDPRWPGFAAIEDDWDIDRKFAHYLTWGGQNRSCFTEWSLAEWMAIAGFTHTVRCYPLRDGGSPTNGPEWMTDLDSRLGESIVVEAW